jgi:hypothetical protein
MDEIEKQFQKVSSQMEQKVDKLGEEVSESGDKLASMGGEGSHDAIVGLVGVTDDLVEKENELNNAYENTEETLKNNIPPATVKTSELFTSFGSTVMSVGATITAAQSAIDTFSNPDASGFEKFGAVIGVVTSAATTFGTV